VTTSSISITYFPSTFGLASKHPIKFSILSCLDSLLLYAPQWFQKVKETPKQSRSESKQERIINLLGCFEADPRVEGKYIILVDDVVTTGSTLSEARKTLLSTEARDVLAFTIAH
jgi:predicted amidophosphoribosyltransferase